jgi:hypothetical protein
MKERNEKKNEVSERPGNFSIYIIITIIAHNIIFDNHSTFIMRFQNPLKNKTMVMCVLVC